jgi:acyl-CoA synthetase (AMP-forming)/AMP-acid ligase II
LVFTQLPATPTRFPRQANPADHLAGRGLVQLQPGAGVDTLNCVLADVKTRLADYKVPEWTIIVDAIPRNPLGKIDRKLAAAMATDRRSAIPA